MTREDFLFELRRLATKAKRQNRGWRNAESDVLLFAFLDDRELEQAWTNARRKVEDWD